MWELATNTLVTINQLVLIFNSKKLAWMILLKSDIITIYHQIVLLIEPNKWMREKNLELVTFSNLKVL